MNTSEETNNQRHEGGQSLFPAETVGETRRKPGKSLQTSRETHCQRPELQGSLIIQSKAAEHYTKGKEVMEKCQYEWAVICFSKAITLQPKQTELHARQGDAYLQLCDFQSAAACYKRARLLQPGAFDACLAFIYNLQGQCLFDRGLFLEALEAFKRATEVKPDCKIYKIRSLSCLTAAGRHGDCLEELSELIAESPSADLYIVRARVHKLMNQTSLCFQDVKSALTLKPTCQEAEALLLQLQEASEEARQQAVLRTLTGQLQEALCLISTALQGSPQDARLYLFRGILYRRLKDFTSAIEDLVQVVELIEEDQVRKEVTGQTAAEVKKDQSESVQKEARIQLALTYNDFAVQCFSGGLYIEATLLLNKAIREEKGLAGLYLNRGDCFFKREDWCYALLDYQQAEEMLPDDPAVWLRLAVIHNTLGSSCFQNGCFKEAVDMFSLALKYNPTVGQYYENRSKAFRKVLNLRGAREDFICLLILDPSNEEVPPMLMSLFPGSSVSEVLSSTKGLSIRAKLTETIQAWSSSSDPTRSTTPASLISLGESVQKMSPTKENTTSQTEKLSEAAKELSWCVNGEDEQRIATALLQVVEAVETSGPKRPASPHCRPHPPPSSPSTSSQKGQSEK
ncbi:tetratricopeptide repeat protein 16 isoform X1 [Kryptolebias marmoratus]|uniref:tetratricopeptide repeat protein 16 isoform X1 n=1 Tax=Kryptolebias marmoratus TaxID=37003 RepID=UPI000D52FAC9|nr:tetratricopeptide repeat protein 16 isoform X1 [Kryptolebias marmoratus]